jgi:hypothetical protein
VYNQPSKSMQNNAVWSRAAPPLFVHFTFCTSL